MRIIITHLALLAVTVGLAATARAAADVPVFELRTYTTEPGTLDVLLARFRDHTAKLLEKHGITNVAYWVPADAKDGAGNKLVFLLAHKSRDAAAAAWREFSADPEWQAVVKAGGASVKSVTKVETVFLAATDYAPAFTPGAGNGAAPRVFELRTYTTPEGGLDALDARFRGGETALFAKSGMTGVTFTHPLDADQGAGHTLIYLLAHANREAAIASWKAFRENPEWVKMKADSEKAAGGPLTSKTQSVFLTPTDFSLTK
jgi:hypothetical protein